MSATGGLKTEGRPFGFFGLLFAISVPFWALGAATGIQLLPGLPIAALGAACPAVAAAILVYLTVGTTGLTALVKRTFDLPFTKIAWLLPVLLLVPAAMTLTYFSMRAAGEPIPAVHVQLVAALLMPPVFLLNALGEELGWSGYALDPLQARLGTLAAALLLGTVWAVWHFVPLVEAHRTPAFIAWWTLGTVSQRIIMVWLYNNTERSVLAVALYHTTTNTSYYLVPGLATMYDPRILGLLLAVVAAAVAFLPSPISRGLERSRAREE